MKAKQIGVVGFWVFNKKEDLFKCESSFLIPNPIKKVVKTGKQKSKSKLKNEVVSKLYQIVFASKTLSGNLFFFYEEQKNDDVLLKMGIID